MLNVAEEQARSQELIHFFHHDYDTVEQYLFFPGKGLSQRGERIEFQWEKCFYLQEGLFGPDIPKGAIHIPTENMPKGSLQVFRLPGLNSLAPALQNQKLLATIVYNPDIKPGPDRMGNVAMIVIAQKWPPVTAQVVKPDTNPYPAGKPAPGSLSPEKKDKAATKGSKARVIKLSHRTPPRTVLKYFSHMTTRLAWQPVFKIMYKRSIYINANRLSQYTSHQKRAGRFYLKGNETLSTALGISIRHVSNILSWMKSQGLIRLRHRGYPGEGNSIWELPFNLAHVFAWLREPPR